MRNKVRIKIPPSGHFHLSPSIVLFSCVILLQILNSFSVMCGSESMFAPNPSHQAVSPDMYRFFIQYQRSHIPSFKDKSSDQSVQGENVGNAGKQDSLDLHNKVGDSMDKGTQEVESGSYGEKQQQFLPAGLLLPKQFAKSTNNPAIFNQANGPFIEKDPSEEVETNGHLGLFGTYSDYDLLPPKQVVVRSRPGHFPINPSSSGGPPVKRSQSLAAAREGYMCHFKLCQFGTSGKRRWSPLFEFD